MSSNKLNPLSVDHLRALYYSSGPFNPPTIAVILSEISEMLIRIGCPLKLASKAKLIMVEALQNAFLYGFENSPDNSYIEIFKEEGTFIVSVTNLVGLNKIIALKDALDYIMTLDKNQIDEHYFNLLSGDGIQGHSGAGLGLLTIAKLSNQNFNFHFEPLGLNASNFKIFIAI